MNSETSSAVMSDEQQATTSGQHCTHGQISQIPGLSPFISNLPETRVRGRRAGVFVGDSDYIKLAKQGGHRGLLWHENIISPTTKSYKPPNLLTSSGDSDLSAKKKNPGAFQTLEPPFGTDNMSAWERDDNSSKEKNNNVPDSQMEESLPYHQPGKFKRIVFDKKTSPVSMSKLLSFGYLEDNKPPIAKTDLSN